MLVSTLCGHAEVSPYCVLSGNTLTFYCDDSMSSRKGAKYDFEYSDGKPKWTAKASSVQTVVFDPSFEAAHPTDGN